MGKIKIRTGRGTGTIEVDEDASKWSEMNLRKSASKKECSIKQDGSHRQRYRF